MKKEEKYNLLLLGLALFVILSIFLFKNQYLFYASIGLSAIVILFKRWVIDTFF